MNNVTEGTCRWRFSDKFNLHSNFENDNTDALQHCKEVALAAENFIQNNKSELEIYVTSCGNVTFGDPLCRGMNVVFGSKKSDTTSMNASKVLQLQLACASIEQTITAVLGYKDGKGPILREMLLSTRMEELIPEPVMNHLRQLLFPEGMNLRNLVSHGFISNPEKAYVAFLTILAIQIPGWCGLERDEVPVFNFLFSENFRNEYSILLKGSSSILFSNKNNPNLPEPLESEEQYLMRAIPVLEHRLRILFCRENSDFLLKDHSKACHGQYFATLDGYGQRSKHILLLQHNYQETDDSRVLPNRLVQKLGPGLHSMLLDLFMQDAGPGIRSLVAHGRCNLSTLFRSTSDPRDDNIFSVAVSIVLSLVDDIEVRESLLWEWIDRYNCPGYYHPITLLSRSLKCAGEELQLFSEFIKSKFITVTDDTLTVKMACESQQDPNAVYTIRDLDIGRVQPVPESRDFLQTWEGWNYSSSSSVEVKDSQMEVVVRLIKRFDEIFNKPLRDNTTEEVKVGQTHSLCHRDICDQISLLVPTLKNNIISLEASLLSGKLRTSKRRAFASSILFLIPTVFSVSSLALRYVEQVSLSPASGSPVVSEKLLKLLIQMKAAAESSLPTDKLLLSLTTFKNSKLCSGL